MNYLNPSRLLRAALTIDAAASGTLAMIQVLAPHAAAQFTGLAVELIVVTGVILGGYAALLIRSASSAAIARTLVELIIVGNLGWALACIAAASVLRNDLTPLGVGYLLFQAGAVVAFACTQALGLIRSGPASPTSARLAWKDTL
jgi:hypothetical protein